MIQLFGQRKARLGYPMLVGSRQDHPPNVEVREFARA